MMRASWWKIGITGFGALLFMLLAGVASERIPLGPSSAHAAERGNYNHLLPKKLSGDRYEFGGEIYMRSASGQLDKDKEKDGVKETLVTIYKTPAGKRVAYYLTHGRVWAWAILPVWTGPENSAIGDTDCDGVFDTKYRFEETFDLPACLKQKR